MNGVIAPGLVAAPDPTRLYIAGPYTQGDPEENTRRAIAAGHEAMDLGFRPFIPHLSHYSHLVRERGYEEWMTLDFAWLEASWALWRLPGASSGADREVARMRALRRPVVYSREDLAHLARFLGLVSAGGERSAGDERQVQLFSTDLR